MKKSGFTLIELLAVIVILAVIALITTPIIIGIIEDSREQANRRSVDGLIRFGVYYVSNSLLDEEKANKIKRQENLIDEISYEGKRPEVGQLFANEQAQVALAVKYDNKCYKKDYDGTVISFDYEREKCLLNINIEKPEISITADNVFNEQGWSKENFYVTINTVDHSDVGTTIKWCGTSNEACEPTTVIDKGIGHIQFTQETSGTKICAKAIDGFSNESEVICSDTYKLDKTNPSFTGIEDIIIHVGDSLDLTNGVSVSDSLSGVNGTYGYSPMNVDTTKSGSYPITYYVEDNAGNVKEITRNVIVNSNNPTINFTAASGAINGNGWAKSNFYVTVNSIDYSGHGIEKIVWCGTTSNTCTPSTEVSGTSQNVLISQESNNNRICAYAIDKGGHTGSTTCSDAYKLDKTAPSFAANSITTADYLSTKKVSEFFTMPTYGISGGSLSCIPLDISGLGLGSHTIQCTATSNSGLSTVLSKDITINKVLTSIVVASTSTHQKQFKVNSSFNSNNLVLEASYNDGSKENITSGYTVTPPSLATAGNVSVGVDYQGKTTTYPIEVGYMWNYYNLVSTTMYRWNQYSVNSSYSLYRTGRTSSQYQVGNMWFGVYYNLTVDENGRIMPVGSPASLSWTDAVGKYYASGGSYYYVSNSNWWANVAGQGIHQYAIDIDLMGARLDESQGITSYGIVESTSSNTYPNNGKNGNYWYVYLGTRINYSQGGTFYGTLFSTNINAYPASGYSGSYWYNRQS